MKRAGLLILLIAAPAFAAAAGAPPTPDAEQPQADVGVLSASAAADCAILAEEMEINFGGEKARSSADAEGILSGISRRDVPAVLNELSKLRASAETRASSNAASVAALQRSILDKLRSVQEPGTAGLVVEELMEKAKAVAEAQSRTEKNVRRLAASTLEKDASALSPKERSALNKLREAQAAVADSTADLEEQARRAANDPGLDAAARRRVAAALSSSDLAAAKAETRGASTSIGEDKLDQAASLSNSALQRLAAFRNALDGRAPRGVADELSRLAAEERKIAGETAAASAASLSDLTRQQREMQSRAQKLASEVPANSIARSYAQAASDEMRSASENLSRAAGGNPKRGAEVSAAQASQQKSADYLDGAAKALEDKTLTETPGKMASAADAVDFARKQMNAIDDLAAKEAALKERTEAAQPRSPAVTKMAGEQEALRKSAMQLTSSAKNEERGRQSAGQEYDSEDAAAASAKLAEASKSMKTASDVLSQAKSRIAANQQEKAQASLQSARDAQARRIAAARRQLSELADAVRRSAPSPMPVRLESALAEIAQGSGSRPPVSASERETASGRPGQLPSERGSSGVGLGGLFPGTSGALNAGAGGATWQAELPPGTPADIVQSASGAFPSGYEEALRRYYEAIARN